MLISRACMMSMDLLFALVSFFFLFTSSERWLTIFVVMPGPNELSVVDTDAIPPILGIDGMRRGPREHNRASLPFDFGANLASRMGCTLPSGNDPTFTRLAGRRTT